MCHRSKKKLGIKKVVQIDFLGGNDSREIDVKPYQILKIKLIRKGNAPVVKVFVQGSQGNKDEATWEDWNI